MILKILFKKFCCRLQGLLDIVDHQKQQVIEHSVINLRIIDWVYYAPEVIYEFFLLHYEAFFSCHMIPIPKESRYPLLLNGLLFLNLHEG